MILICFHLEQCHSVLEVLVSNLSIALSSWACLGTSLVNQQQQYQYSGTSISTQDLETCNSNTPHSFFQGSCFFECFFFTRDKHHYVGLQSPTHLPDISDSSLVILLNSLANKEALTSILAVKFLTVHMLHLMWRRAISSAVYCNVCFIVFWSILYTCK